MNRDVVLFSSATTGTVNQRSCELSRWDYVTNRAPRVCSESYQENSRDMVQTMKSHLFKLISHKRAAGVILYGRISLMLVAHSSALNRLTFKLEEKAGHVRFTKMIFLGLKYSLRVMGRVFAHSVIQITRTTSLSMLFIRYFDMMLRFKVLNLSFGDSSTRRACVVRREAAVRLIDYEKSSRSCFI